MINTQYLYFVHGQCSISFPDINESHLHIESHVPDV